MPGPPRLARLLPLLLAIAIPLLAIAAPARAQEPGAEEGSDEDAPEVVYVPYEDIREILRDGPSSVQLPYDEFQRLWEAARGPRPDPGDAWVMGESAWEATVEQPDRDGPAVVRLEGTVDLEVLEPGWRRIPLPFEGAALSDVSVETPEGGSGVLGLGEARDGEDPPVTLAASGTGRYRVRVHLAANASGEEMREASLRVPATPLTRVTFTVPDERARPEIPGAAAAQQETAEGSSTVRAFLPPDGRLDLRWTASPREEAPTRARISTELGVRATVRPDRLVCRVDATFEASRAEVDVFRLAIPDGFSVLEPSGDRLAGTTVTDEPGVGRVLEARPHAPVVGTFRFRVRLEAERASPTDEVHVPVIRAPDARSETGWVALHAVTGLRTEVTELAGASRVEPSTLPGDLGSEADHAFRYLTLPHAIRASVEELAPRVRANVRHGVAISSDRMVVRTRFDLRVADAPLFDLVLTDPGEGVEVEGVEASGGRALRHRREDGRIVCSLERPVDPGHRFRLDVRLELDRGEEDPPEVAVPLVGVVDAETEEGTVSVGASPALDLVVLEDEGLSPAPPGVAGVPAGLVEGEVTSRFGRRYPARPVSLHVEVTERSPRVRARVARSIHVAEGRIEDDAAIHLTIDFAPIASLTVELPAGLEDEDMDVAGIQEAEVRDEVTDDDVLHRTIVFQSPVEGEQTLRLSREQDLPDVDPGEGAGVEIPRLVVRDVVAETGHVAVSSGESLVVVLDAEGTEGLRQIDVRELPDGLQGSGERNPDEAFEYSTPGSRLAFTVYRYDYAPMLRVFAESLHVETEISTQEPWAARSEMFCFLRQNRIPNVILRLPDGSRLDQVIVDGEPVQHATRPDADDEYLVNLARGGGTGSGPIWIAARYETPLPGAFGALGSIVLEPPALAGGDGEIPTGRFTWRVWVPDEQTELLSVTTELRELFERPGWWPWLRDLILGGEDEGYRPASEEDASLLRAAEEARDSAESAGFHYRLRPTGRPLPFGSPGEGASVSLRYAGTKTYWFLDFLVFLAVLVGGIALGRSEATDTLGRATLALAFPLAVLALAVVLPEGIAAFAGAAFLATGAVLVLWAVAFFATELPGRIAAARVEAIARATGQMEVEEGTATSEDEEAGDQEETGDEDEADDEEASDGGDVPSDGEGGEDRE